MRLLLSLPLLAGCTFAASQVDPPLGQLARWRDATPAVIAAEPVVQPCPAENPACPRLHARRAEACMAQAMAQRAPGAACPPLAAAPLLACAAEGYEQAPASPVTAADGALARLCAAELAAPEAALEGARRAATLAAQAGPERAPGLLAWAALLRARLSAPPARCAAAAEATRLAAQLPAERQGRLLADLALLKGC